jgi:hypothetical protein
MAPQKSRDDAVTEFVTCIERCEQASYRRHLHFTLARKFKHIFFSHRRIQAKILSSLPVCKKNRSASNREDHASRCSVVVVRKEKRYLLNSC